MQIQRQSPGLEQLLAKLLPGLGGAIGGAAGGPVGSAFGGAAGAGLGGLINQKQPEPQILGQGKGMNQVASPQGGGLEAGLMELLSRLSNMQSQKENQQQEGAPEEATQAAEEEQKGTLKDYFDKLSPDGKQSMIMLLKSIAGGVV